jgi:NTE family protein
VTTDYARIQLLKLHPVVQGLNDAAIHEIAAAAEVVHCEAGHVLCHPDEAVTSIFLIIHGRVRLELMDLHGRVVMSRRQGRGGQVGGIAALLAEPQPFLCTSEEPSTLLKLEYAQASSLARKYDLLRENIARSIADSVKRAIIQDKAARPTRISAFFHRSDATRVVSRRAIERLVQLGESLHRFADRSSPIDGVCERSLVEGEHIVSGEEVWRQVAEWLPRGRILFDFDMDVEYARASRALEACEQVFWCVTPGNWEDAVAPLRALLVRSAELRDKVCLVWLIEGGKIVPVANELRRLASRDIKVRFGVPDSTLGPATFAGIERLVHLLRGVQIGVALGGGAARGMAHLGVLSALEQCGITIDMIAGTSAGAMTGTVYSAGCPSDFLVEKFVADLRPPWFFRRLPRGDQWYLLYKYRTGQFEPMLRKYLGSARLEQHYVPMHTVALDLISGREVVRSTGDAVQGILESINLPLLAIPINRDGQALVDGGLINNVPANVLAARGCNFVIAVSVTAKMEWMFAQNRSDTPVDRMRRASTIQTLLRSFLVQSHSVNAVGVQPADFMIEPDVTAFDLSSFGRTRELASIGESAALAAAQQILSLLNHLDPGLFPQTTNQLASGGPVTTPVLSRQPRNTPCSR